MTPPAHRTGHPPSKKDITKQTNITTTSIKIKFCGVKLKNDDIKIAICTEDAIFA